VRQYGGDPCELGADRRQEWLWGLGEAEVPGVRQFDEPGVTDGVGDRAAAGGWADPIVATDDDERRDADPRELGRTSYAPRP